MNSASDAFRAELRAWLAAHPPPALANAITLDDAETLRTWQRTLNADRWVGIHWPEEFGGRAATAPQVAIYNEELARAGAPPLLGRAGVTLVGPTLIAHGTDAQRARWMPGILSGDDVWCQLFSEPDAGSDLVALSTRADRRDGAYRVTGQKVWSSYARFASMGIALVRTDPGAPPHKGISMLAIPMDANGVDVRPLRQMTGESEFSEVFLHDVEVPLDHCIRPEHEGWRVANTTLANERGASFIWREQIHQELAVDALAQQCAPVADPCVRQELAHAHTRAELFRLHNARTLARIERGDEIGAESSLVKLFWANTSQQLYEMASTVAGPGEPWDYGLLATRANSIMGGTSEIQRNIIGERLLGLPREPTAKRPEEAEREGDPVKAEPR
jgi:alkylation response protein AidB-like acyl-CoA dehydrogenase